MHEGRVFEASRHARAAAVLLLIRAVCGANTAGGVMLLVMVDFTPEP